MMTPLRARERISMHPVPPDGPEDDPCDPVTLHIAASELDVYRHERLAYTEIPARRPKSKRPVSSGLKKFLAAVYYWVIARC
jgi:hypothetical protein